MSERGESHRLPCGGTAIFDHSSGISYRCDSCFAVVGSIGMPRECYDLWKTSARPLSANSRALISAIRQPAKDEGK